MSKSLLDTVQAETIMILTVVIISSFTLALVLLAVRKLKAWNAESTAFRSRFHARESDIEALSFDDARLQAEALLADTSVCECVLAPTTESMDFLAPVLRSFFHKFELVRLVDQESRLDRKAISRFGWEWTEGPWRKHQFWQIGSDLEHTLILVKPGQEGIYETDGSDFDPEKPDYATVYHWLLMVSSRFD